MAVLHIPQYPTETNLAVSFHKSLRVGAVFTEFLSRFYEMCGLISERLFGGKPVTVNRSLHNWGTPRWQGRMPVAVETDAGTCYYKPRDCRIDVFYHDLVKTLIAKNGLFAELVRRQLL